jgi:hypothetical protein
MTCKAALPIRSAILLAASAVIWHAALSACSAAGAEGKQPESRLLSESEANSGIRVVSLQPTAGGQMLDLRYQVVDPEKARSILDRNKKAYLLDGKTGKTLPVPLTKAGSMRQTTRKPETGRTYFMLFSNPGGLVKEGGSVSLLVGDFRRDGIIVGDPGAATASAGNPAVPKSDKGPKP